MSKPFYTQLPNRDLVRIEGDDRKSFLQGLVSNDLEKVAPGILLYACLLTPQGKFLHDFFVAEENDVLLLDCEGGARARDLYDRLLKYRLRSKVQLAVQEQNKVYAVFDAPDIGLKDPRHPDLGTRTFEKPAFEEKSFSVWDEKRINLTIPDGSRDMEIERSTLLECGIDHLNGIDWKKGCYMGQELTARMHYRGLAKKHLYTVSFEGPALAPFTDLSNGGSFRSSSGNIGLALLKDEGPDDERIKRIAR